MSMIGQSSVQIFLKYFFVLVIHATAFSGENHFSFLPDDLVLKLVYPIPGTIVPLYLTCKDLQLKMGLWCRHLEKKNALEVLSNACDLNLTHTVRFVLIKNQCIISPDVGAILHISGWRGPLFPSVSDDCRNVIEKIYPNAQGNAYFYAHDYICIISGKLCRAGGLVYQHASYALQNERNLKVIAQG